MEINSDIYDFDTSNQLAISKQNTTEMNVVNMKYLMIVGKINTVD